MGCWNKTCGITGLPILSGTPVYLFVLEQVWFHQRSYTTSFWRPVILNSKCVYDDYGGGEDWDRALPKIVEKFEIDEEKFFDRVNRGKLTSYSDVHHRDIAIDFVMIRADVVDEILDTGVSYDASGKQQNTYHEMLAELPAVAAKMVQLTNSKNLKIDSLVAKLGTKTVLGDLLEWINFEFSTIIRLRELCTDESTCEEFLRSVLITHFVDHFMSMVRKQWFPAGHEGSQQGITDEYQRLITIMSNALNTCQSEYK